MIGTGSIIVVRIHREVFMMYRLIAAVCVLTAGILPMTVQADITFDVSGNSGSFWLLDPGGNDLIYRMTLNLGITETDVLDVGDATVVQSPQEITEPEFAEQETEWVIEFLDANENPLGVTATHRMYDWADGNYLILRYSIANGMASPLVPHVSAEIIPTLEGYGEYGGETSDFNSDEDVAFFHEAGRYLGFRYLNVPIFSYRTPGYADYEDAENNETFRYTEMANPEDSSFPITDGYGLLVFVNAGEHAAEPGNTIDVFIAIGFGTAEDDMVEEILAAVTRYDEWTTGVELEGIQGIPGIIELGSVYPNPFADQATIPFTINRPATVSLAMYDLGGRLCASLLNGSLQAGMYEMSWDGRDDLGTMLESGIYLCVLHADGSAWTERQMIRTVFIR